MKYILTSALVVLICISSIAQRDRQDRKKIESLRIAYLTDELDLSAAEAQAFWPVFNEYEQQRTELRKSKNNLLSEDDNSSTDAIAEFIKLEEAELQLLKEFVLDIKEVLSDQKIITLISSEKRFKERLIKRLNSKRRNN